nr:MAG: hypothetical protein DIU80_02420 [Chloroflexota bacterium]
MKCGNCGEELPAGAMFCPNCGTRTSPSTPPSAPTTYVGPEPGQPAAPPPLVMPPTPERTQEPAQPYAPPAYYAPPQPPTSNTAIVSLVFGILTWTVLPLISAVIAVIAGHMARNEIRRSEGKLGGDGLAIAGMIMGYVQLVLVIIGLCAALAFFLIIAAAASAGS